jgi:cbb3-type cytochrome oxidase subunit 1
MKIVLLLLPTLNPVRCSTQFLFSNECYQGSSPVPQRLWFKHSTVLLSPVFVGMTFYFFPMENETHFSIFVFLP